MNDVLTDLFPAGGLQLSNQPETGRKRRGELKFHHFQSVQRLGPPKKERERENPTSGKMAQTES